MLAILLDDADFWRTDALVDAIQLIGVTTTVAITTAWATGTISTLTTTTAEGSGAA
ncbi:MAG: hypothetical protein IPK22_28020 [Verrucomicrobiaceae bacterium]|nr:hypothetical protein [Verrucomicrobiaceae bacterium]